jgi:hypothetical protein
MIYKMKKYIFLFFLLTGFNYLMEAQVKIGDNIDEMDPSSILELESTDKGLLIPRLTTAEVTAIRNPANGLLVYNSELNLLQINIGTADNPLWVSIPVTVGSGNTGALLFPVGTDAERPVNPVNNMLRYNTTDSKFEIYLDGTWTSLD